VGVKRWAGGSCLLTINSLLAKKSLTEKETHEVRRLIKIWQYNLKIFEKPKAKKQKEKKGRNRRRTTTTTLTCWWRVGDRGPDCQAGWYPQ
jgi:hypothetical protein